MEKVVSKATLRSQDLIPSFLEELRELNSNRYQQIQEAIPSSAYEDDEDPFWDSAAAGFLLEELFEALNEEAPSGTYFGAHEGDGSLFGFWEIEQQDYI